MKTILETVIENNSELIDFDYSDVYNVHHSLFSKRTKSYKDADKLAVKIASVYPELDFDVYVVVTHIGRNQHSTSDVLLIALPANVELNSCCRTSRKLISVS